MSRKGPTNPRRIGRFLAPELPKGFSAAQSEGLAVGGTLGNARGIRSVGCGSLGRATVVLLSVGSSAGLLLACVASPLTWSRAFGVTQRFPPILWIAIALSLAYRALYFVQIQGNPFFDAPIMDEAYHDAWAEEVAAGDLSSKIPFFRAPFYPFFLGAMYKFVGRDFAFIRGFQLVLGALSPFLAYLLWIRLRPRDTQGAGFFATLTGLDSLLFYYEADLLLESLLAPLSLGFCLALAHAIERKTWPRWFAVGILMGVFTITRPNILLFAPIAFALALFGSRGMGSPDARGGRFSLRWGEAFAVALGTCLIVLPVTSANWFLGGDRVLVASQGGLNFFLGNNEEANGWSATAPKIMRTDWWGGYEDAIQIAEKAEGRALRPSEVSKYWTRRAMEWWRENPGDGVLLTLKKSIYFLSGQEFSNNRNLDLFLEDYAPCAIPGKYVLFVATPLACWGMVIVWRRRRAVDRALVLYFLVYAATVILFFVTARYRIPIRPLILLFAIEGARSIVSSFRASPAKGLIPASGVVALGLALNLNPWVASYEAPPAQFYQSIANIYHERKNVPEALRFQQKTLEIDPQYPDAHLNLGTMLLAQGNVSGAVEEFREECRIDPKDGRAWASLGQALTQRGDFVAGEESYSQADSVGWKDVAVTYNHAILLERLGRTEEARSRYLRATEIDSSFVDAWLNLGVLEARSGNLGRAIEYWNRADFLRPGDPKIRENLERAQDRLANP